MDTKNEPYKNKRYLGMALDPVHIGTGGYRLGRVDNTIARDAGTNLPIIFGSSIEGTARTYAYYQGLATGRGCAGKTDEKDLQKQQCGRCRVCITFGYTNDRIRPSSLHGMAQFSDAKILFFPVHTMLGPVWVASPQCLKEAEIHAEDFDSESWLTLNNELSELKEKKSLEYLWIPGNFRSKPTSRKLNLGWLYLNCIELNPSPPDPEEWLFKENDREEQLKDIDKSLREILKRVVVVSDALFHQIVNSNLEVRTSVSINPETGAAEEHALFTYEAIPRTTIMYLDVVYNNPQHFEGIPDLFKNFGTIKDTVKESFRLFEHLGLGGMGTRGFGRFKILNLECDRDDKQE